MKENNLQERNEINQRIPYEKHEHLIKILEPEKKIPTEEKNIQPEGSAKQKKGELQKKHMALFNCLAINEKFNLLF